MYSIKEIAFCLFCRFCCLCSFQKQTFYYIMIEILQPRFSLFQLISKLSLAIKTNHTTRKDMKNGSEKLSFLYWTVSFEVTLVFRKDVMICFYQTHFVLDFRYKSNPKPTPKTEEPSTTSASASRRTYPPKPTTARSKYSYDKNRYRGDEPTLRPYTPTLRPYTPTLKPYTPTSPSTSRQSTTGRFTQCQTRGCED